MPKLLALGGPRDGRLVHIDDPAQETTFELQPPLPTEDPTVARYRRARLAGGTEVLVSADVPDDADLDALHAKAQTAYRDSRQWSDDDDAD
jgi:hypothetical protein